MADLINSALQADPVGVAISSVQAGFAIATWWQNRQRASKITLAALPPGESAPEVDAAQLLSKSSDELFLVLSTLGQRLLALDAIYHSALPYAREAVRSALRIGDLEADDLGDKFDDLDDILQYTVTCAVVFCSECWPMHMYRGFGCGVLANTRWANPHPPELDYFLFKAMDKALAYLKSVPRNWQLLWKSPSAIGRTQPYLFKYPKESRKLSDSMAKELIALWEKWGFPQPRTPYDYIKITNWEVPFATWGWQGMYDVHGHDLSLVRRYQLDPGRFLYAWTTGDHANIKPGIAIYPSQPHINELALWMQGHRGVTWKVLLDSELESNRFRFSRAMRKVNVKLTGNEDGMNGDPAVIVFDSKWQQQPHRRSEVEATTIEERYSALAISPRDPSSVTSPVSPVSTTGGYFDSSSQSVGSAPSPIASPTPSITTKSPLQSSIVRKPVGGSILRRRPPPPPPTARPLAKVKYAFRAENIDELEVVAEDVVEIMGEDEDGWTKVRKQAVPTRQGVIPTDYLERLP